MTFEDNDKQSQKAGRKSSLVKWIVIAGIGAALAGGAGVASAVSDDLRLPAQMVRMGWGGGWHHGMAGHHGGKGFGRVLEELDLTEEQEDRIWEIAGDMRGEALPLFRELRDTREELAELLGAPTIDRAAVEALRAERIGQIDEASKKLVAALTQAAEVLTPEQRAELAEEIEEHGRRGWW